MADLDKEFESLPERREKSKGGSKVMDIDAEWDKLPGGIKTGADATGMITKKGEFWSPFLHGAGSAFTFNTSDEIAAMLRSALNPDLTYYEALQDEQRKLEEAREQNPKAYLGGEIVGSTGTMAIPGLGLAGNALRGAKAAEAAWAFAKAAKLAQAAGQTARAGKWARLGSSWLGRSLLEGAKAGAKQGALSGFGKSQSWFQPAEEETTDMENLINKGIDTGNIALQTAQGATEGAITGPLVNLATAPIGWALDKTIMPPLKRGLAKILSPTARPIFGVTKDMADEVLASPATYQRPQEKVPDLMDDFVIANLNIQSATTNALRQEARDTLSDTAAAIPVGDAFDLVHNAMKEGGFIYDYIDPKTGKLFEKSRFGKAALDKVNNELERIYSLGGPKGFLTQKQVREYMDEIKSDTKFEKWGEDLRKNAAGAYNRIYGRLNETLPEIYHQKMEPVREQTAFLDRFGDIVGLKRAKLSYDSAPEFAANDANYKKLQAIRNNQASGKAFAEFGKRFGYEDLVEMAKRSRTEPYFDYKSPGFRAATLGAAFGPPGAIVGAGLDIAGRKMFMNLAKKTAPTARPPWGGPLTDFFVRRPAVELMTSPALDPYYMGMPPEWDPAKWRQEMDELERQGE